jgi:hypothetical protein
VRGKEDSALVLKLWSCFPLARRIAGWGLVCLVLAGCGGSNKTSPQIDWVTPAPITYGTALSAKQLNATASIPGAFAYSPLAGTVLPAGSHTLSVTFTPTDATDYTTAAASVTLAVNQVVPVVSWAAPAAITYGTALSATQLNATASVPGAFAYTPSLGTVLSAGSQTLSVTFTPTDATDYATVTTSVTLTVNQVVPVVSWTAPAAITYGTALSATQLNATANFPGTFKYSPSLGTLLSAGSHTLSATFTPTDATDYAIVTTSVTLIVNQVVSVLSWTAPAAITYGTALSATQLDATASVAGGFSYSPSLGAVLSAGSHTLSVTFTPTDATDYTAAAASVTLAVNQATPRIAWAPAFPIAVGVALGPGQLNATATAPGGTTEVAGSFIYSPAAGTIFNSPGPQTLSVTFTPADTADYTTAQASLTLTASSFGVAAWGDSLTYGEEGSFDKGAYPEALQSLLLLPVENLGVKGQTSTQIGVREGGVPTYATVAGGIIPATGGVTVTFPTGYEPVTIDGPAAGVSGTIQGVHGLVKLDSGVYTFTPTTPGVPVSAPGSPQFVVDTPYASYLPVFWEGEDNYSQETQILSDIAAQVATVPSGQNYLVISIINENAQTEWIGGSDYKRIVAVNSQLAAIYGSHYLDIWTVLVDSYDPTSITDVSDYNHYEVPTSLRAIDAYTTLVNPIGPADTTVTVQSRDDLAVGDILTIDTGANAENVAITAISGDTLTVLRDFGGVDTSHAAGASVTATEIVHLNAQGAQIVANAVAQYLSAYEVSAP